MKTIKYKKVARICRMIMEKTGLSGRAIARALGIHHRTWQRYLRGSHSPVAEIRERMVRLIGAESYHALSRPSNHPPPPG